MRRTGSSAISLFKKSALIAFVAGLAFIGIRLFLFFRADALRPAAKFPDVGSSTSILLNIEYPKPRRVDLSGRDEIIHAIGDLKQQHIVGRSIGPTRVHGVLVVDGKGFKLDACMIDSGYRATVEDQKEAWESRELGEVLYKLYGGG